MLKRHRMELRLGALLPFTLVFALNAFGASGPATLENNDSCDISVTPAATLLLPYFEVDLEDPAGETTLITITNVMSAEQVARITLWTDRSYPVVTFNVYLTGYDVHSINLYDVLKGGVIGPIFGTGTLVSPTGTRSVSNHLLDTSQCGIITPYLDAATMARMQEAFTEGTISGVCDQAGNIHENAVGYATIDVVGNCDVTGPHDPEYFTRDLRYDNVLTGDYQQVNSQQNAAQGGTLVHIRAIPEGSTPQIRAVLSRYETTFDKTFYGRFQGASNRTLDARQPLPSTFVTRWINGGRGAFQTSLKIWRQGMTNASAKCADYAKHRELKMTESVVFDEHGNGEGNAAEPCSVTTCIPSPELVLPITSRSSLEPGAEAFPQSILSSTVAGWIYLNLDDGSPTGIDGQSWVIASMAAEGRYSVDFDAGWLGNGCSPVAPATSYSNEALPPVGNYIKPTPAGAILPGPAADVNPR
jgi:hypothetical protein